MSENILGTRITDLLNKKGMTQRQLADRAGVTEVSVSRYINGTRIPKAVQLANIARVLGVTSEYLLGNDEGSSMSPCDKDFFETTKLIARSASSWSADQKNELARALFGS